MQVELLRLESVIVPYFAPQVHMCADYSLNYHDRVSIIPQIITTDRSTKCTHIIAPRVEAPPHHYYGTLYYGVLFNH